MPFPGWGGEKEWTETLVGLYKGATFCRRVWLGGGHTAKEERERLGLDFNPVLPSQRLRGGTPLCSPVRDPQIKKRVWIDMPARPVCISSATWGAGSPAPWRVYLDSSGRDGFRWCLSEKAADQMSPKARLLRTPSWTRFWPWMVPHYKSKVAAYIMPGWWPCHARWNQKVFGIVAWRGRSCTVGSPWVLWTLYALPSKTGGVLPVASGPSISQKWSDKDIFHAANFSDRLPSITKPPCTHCAHMGLDGGGGDPTWWSQLSLTDRQGEIATACACEKEVISGGGWCVVVKYYQVGVLWPWTSFDASINHICA